MEGVLRKKAAAIVQQREGWCGITFSINDRDIDGLAVFEEQTFEEAKKFVGDDHYGLALDDGSVFLFDLAFPFSDKRKIRLVLKNELEQRLPVSMEDMQIDFVANGKGKVFAAAVPKNLVGDLSVGRQLKTVTVQSLAALFALKWFRWIGDEDFVLLHMNGNTVAVIAIKEGGVHYLRQFFHSPESDALDDAVGHILSDGSYAPRSFTMIGDGGPISRDQKRLQEKFRIVIETPSIRHFVPQVDLPEWGWAAIGTALMSLNPKGQINLVDRRPVYPFLSSKAGLYASASLACLGLLTCGLSYFDYCLKDRALKYLQSEPGRLYRLSFPKSPPARDTTGAFRDKIKAMENQPTSAGTVMSPLMILNDISAKVPAELDVKIDEFTSDEKEFILSGTTTSFAAAEKVKAGMEQVRGVLQVETQSLELTGNKQIKFKMRGRL
jgi:hypothetical protein